MSYRELLVGCGNSRKKKIHQSDRPETFQNLTTLDMSPETGCDVVHDLDMLPYPFGDNSFDEIHAYDVLEHQGRQGDWRFFFAQFGEFWRMLKPGGIFSAIVPAWDSPWSFGDPGHTRVIPKESLVFLSQATYAREVGRTNMTDYRPWWKGDLETIALSDIGEHQFGFILKAIK